MSVPAVQKTAISIFSIHSLLLLGLIGVGGFIFLNRLSKKSQIQNTHEFNTWVNSSLAKILSKKLSIPSEDILLFLNEKNNNELGEKLKELIKSVNLFLTKEKNYIIVKLVVLYKDSSTMEVSTERTWENIPNENREIFLRTGDTSISYEWNYFQ